MMLSSPAFSPQTAWKGGFPLWETRTEEQQLHCTPSRVKLRWTLFTAKVSFLFHLHHTISPLQSWSNIRLFHYSKVEMKSLMLDRLSKLPAGPRYSSRREPLHHSRYAACTSSTFHTVHWGRSWPEVHPHVCEPVWLKRCLGLEKPPTSRDEWCRRGLRCLSLLNENPRRNERDPRVHANQYMHSESTAHICFH